MKLKQSELDARIAQMVAEAAEKAFGTKFDEYNQRQSNLIDVLAKNANNDSKLPNAYDERGFKAARLIRALAGGKGDPERALKWAKATWGVTDNDPVIKALAVGTTTAGGYLVPDEFSTDLIALLRPASVVRSLGPVIVPMNGGTMRFPRQTGGSSASYIGENTTIPVSQPTFGQLTLSWKKLAALVPISNDLLRQSNPSADQIVRDDIVLAIAQREDVGFIRDTGSSGTPKGIKNWAATGMTFHATQAGAAATADEIRGDFTKARLLMRQKNGKMARLGMIMSPRSEAYLMDITNGSGNPIYRDEMENNGTFRRIPYRVTTQIPENLGTGTNESEIIIADFNDVIIGESMNLIIDASSEAAYFDGSNTVSAYSLDQTVIRAITEHDLLVRSDAAVVVIDQVKWGA